MQPYERKKVFVTVKTYPTPASKGAEASCTAGVTDDGKWIRLFPIPFRYMEGEKQFSKYQWIEVAARKSSDPRKESFEVDIATLKILSDPLPSKDAWKVRKQIILPLEAPSLCHLQRTRKQTGDTLGIFKPRTIHKFVIESDTPDWTSAEREKLLQFSLYDKHPLKPLEKIPYKFSYRFTCDEPRCEGHKLICIDWELGQAYRQWKQKYGTKWEWAVINRFETDMIFKYDTLFFVGTIHGHPSAWIIIGLFYPPKR
ncbi:MAG: hypothetical protein JXB43_07850 [Dehalococcoidia bacterium]|nr:hypothetical protein [Dehalococcoidia bacterium]